VSSNPYPLQSLEILATRAGDLGLLLVASMGFACLSASYHCSA